VFIPDGAEAVPSVVQQLYANGLPKGRVQLMGTGLWDDSRMFNDPNLQGGWFAAPDPQGFRNFSQRYKQRFGSDPVRTATLSYDAVALVAALVKTQGAQRFSETILTNPSGFSGIDGLFRFRQDGTNERGLAVHRISGNGSTIISPPPRAFSASGY
jgi:ABC-type branched-subunit amino acid transport system substrate-binding protein